MGQQVVTICDGCGKEHFTSMGDIKGPTHWLKIDIEVLGIGEQEHAFVCSNDCFNRFTQKKLDS
jgi:hypothetical protein